MAPTDFDIPTFPLKAHTGPAAAREVAAGLKAAGALDVLEGTEHVYISFEGEDIHDAVYKANEAFGRDASKKFGWLKFKPAR